MGWGNAIKMCCLTTHSCSRPVVGLQCVLGCSAVPMLSRAYLCVSIGGAMGMLGMLQCWVCFNISTCEVRYAQHTLLILIDPFIKFHWHLAHLIPLRLHCFDVIFKSQNAQNSKFPGALPRTPLQWGAYSASSHRTLDGGEGAGCPLPKNPPRTRPFGPRTQHIHYPHFIPRRRAAAYDYALLLLLRILRCRLG